jgi:hypothetical protein
MGCIKQWPKRGCIKTLEHQRMIQLYFIVEKETIK